MDAATASEAEDVVVAQDGSPAVRPVPVHVSPVAMAGAVPQQRQGWRQQESEEGEDTKKMRAMWFKDMRGWLMVLAMQIASSTYQAGLNPPRGFSGDTSHSTPILESTSHSR
nr:unnamed protein product [Digitaria exilis]